MILSLIGMSNVGKTHWSRKLEALGFVRYGCDDEIERVLGVDDLAAWMGFPDSPTYRAREKEYLDAEVSVMRSVLDRLDGIAVDVVIDTTGSVVYLGDGLLDELRARTKIVYLRASDGAVAAMAEKYFACPKPVVWGDAFIPSTDEARDETLRRCYPALLAWRDERYARLAHLTIPV
jgi:shikimate kinase